jgi:hypothetical protein
MQDYRPLATVRALVVYRFLRTIPFPNPPAPDARSVFATNVAFMATASVVISERRTSVLHIYTARSLTHFSVLFADFHTQRKGKIHHIHSQPQHSPADGSLSFVSSGSSGEGALVKRRRMIRRKR